MSCTTRCSTTVSVDVSGAMPKAATTPSSGTTASAASHAAKSGPAVPESGVRRGAFSARIAFFFSIGRLRVAKVSRKAAIGLRMGRKRHAQQRELRRCRNQCLRHRPSAGCSGVFMVDVQESLKVIKRGCDELLVEEEMVEKLERAARCASRPDSIRPHPICISAIPCCSTRCGSSRTSVIR